MWTTAPESPMSLGRALAAGTSRGSSCCSVPSPFPESAPASSTAPVISLGRNVVQPLQPRS